MLLEQRTGIKTSHIPFRGAAPAVTALLGKHVDAAWLLAAPLLSSIEDGKLKALSVTGAARDPKLPNVPTAEESGLADFQIVNWQGLFAPAGTPQPIVDKIAQAVADVVRQAGDSRAAREGRLRRARRWPRRGGRAGPHECRALVEMSSCGQASEPGDVQ